MVLRPNRLQIGWGERRRQADKGTLGELQKADCDTDSSDRIAAGLVLDGFTLPGYRREGGHGR